MGGPGLEYPGTDEGPDWDSLYRSRGDEVVAHRPFFTGDVCQSTKVQSIGHSRTRTIILVQHPCALRTDGVQLAKRLLVAEVRPSASLPREGWSGNFNRMPLPEFIPAAEGNKRDQAAFFDSPYLVASEDLDPANRIACLSPIVVNLLPQRWVAHNSRAVIPTADYQALTSGPYEEADLIEEWCERRPAADVDQATKEAVDWLRQDLGQGVPLRQHQLTDPQRISGIRKEMRWVLRDELAL